MGKLEGPKKHHDAHGKDASVPGKKPIPKEHWEMHYDLCKSHSNTPASAFLPKRSKDRPQPYEKINPEDH